MMNGKRPQEATKFRLETRELRATQSENPAAPAADPAEPNPRDAGGGFDPYNSSGGFDRRKNWERVGKRSR
jgi:hypothetical protein